MAAPTRAQIEANIASLTDNLAQMIEWYGEESIQAARIRSILERRRVNLRALDAPRKEAV